MPIQQKTYKITSPTGEEFTVQNLTQFCKDNELNPKYMAVVARGERPTHKGFRVETIDHGSGVIPKNIRSE